MLETLEDIRDTIDLAQQEFVATVDRYKRLASKQVNSAELVKYIRLVFCLKERDRTPAQQKQEKIVPRVVRLFEYGRGSRMAGKTYWGAYNAVNEYLNYFRGECQDNTLSSLWYGEGASLNKRALEIATDRTN